MQNIRISKRDYMQMTLNKVCKLPHQFPGLVSHFLGLEKKGGSGSNIRWNKPGVGEVGSWRKEEAPTCPSFQSDYF